MSENHFENVPHRNGDGHFGTATVLQLPKDTKRITHKREGLRMGGITGKANDILCFEREALKVWLRHDNEKTELLCWLASLVLYGFFSSFPFLHMCLIRKFYFSLESCSVRIKNGNWWVKQLCWNISLEIAFWWQSVTMEWVQFYHQNKWGRREASIPHNPQPRRLDIVCVNENSFSWLSICIV